MVQDLSRSAFRPLRPRSLSILSQLEKETKTLMEAAIESPALPIDFSCLMTMIFGHKTHINAIPF